MALVLDGTNGVSGVDGTASNPAIEGTDSNTGIFYPAADTVAIGTGGTERLRVDSAGNAGLGVTPAAWRTGSDKAFQIGAWMGLYTDSGVTSEITYNTYVNSSSAFVRLNTGSATRYRQYLGAHDWFTAGSSSAGSTITFTQAMTLDASGNLGVGTTSPTNTAGYQTIEVNGSSGGIVRASFSTSVKGYYFANSAGVTLGAETNDALIFRTNATERARITSGGILLVGTTSDANLPGSGTNNATGVAVGGNQVRACRDQYTFQIGVTNTGAGVFLQQFFQAGTNCGQITVSNSNATAYQTSSDYRLKDNPQPMIGALEKVAALKPCTWTWKNSGTAGQGFIAHEVQQYFPDAVSGEKDAVDSEGNPQYQGIDTSFLVATLTAAIQEQQAMIEEMKAEIAALKAQP